MQIVSQIYHINIVIPKWYWGGGLRQDLILTGAFRNSTVAFHGEPETNIHFDIWMRLTPPPVCYDNPIFGSFHYKC